MRAIDQLLRSYLSRRGFSISRSITRQGDGDYFLHEYLDGKNGFDYEQYKAVQVEGNKRKIHQVWTDRETIEAIAAFLRGTGMNLRRGLCHGSRNGTEVGWFRECLGIDVIGTDISDTATQFPHMVQWDFHDENPEWRGQFDFVYTNSHDHAYDPKKAMRAWVDQLTPDGVLILEHTMAHSESRANELDPFGINPRNLPYVVLKFGEGRFCVTRILEPAHKRPKVDHTWVFVIRRQTDDV